MSSLFVCPLCGGALTRREGSYLCPAGHCFDIAREGYTYLLPVNRKHSRAPATTRLWPQRGTPFWKRATTPRYAKNYVNSLWS